MSSKKAVPWLALVLIALLILLIAAISVPNLLRARISSYESSRLSRLRTLSESSETQSDQSSSNDSSNQPERKIVLTAALDLIVLDVRDTASRIEALAEGEGGYVEKSELIASYSGQQSADLVIRVPQSKLGRIRTELKQLAQRVDADKSEARDVTREFVDSEARLRNLKAEEAQYLELMHRSASVKDIADITARASEVRGKIEQLQGELQYLSHQVEMSSIAITLSTEYSAADHSLEWHPFSHAKLAFRDMLEGVTGYVDSMVSVALFVPVVLLWAFTVIAMLVSGWKILRWVWRKFVRPASQQTPAET